MAFTTRLPELLQQEAEAYAATLGISLNALVAIALRDYLDIRHQRGLSQGAPLPSDPVTPAATLDAGTGGNGQFPPPGASTAVPKVTPANLQRFVETRVATPKNIDPRLSLDADELGAIPRKVMRSPCWCGSGKELRRCHRRLKLPSD